jgi:hypothetical protein
MKVVTNSGDGERYVKLSDICAWLIAGGVPEAAQVLLEAEVEYGC